MPTKIKLTIKQDRDIARLWKTEEYNLTSLGRIYKVSKDVIRRSLVRTSSDLSLIKTGNNPSPITDKTTIRKVVCDYRDKEMSMMSIAEKYGASITFLRKLLVNNNVSIRPQIKVGNLNHVKIEKIAAAWDAGKSAKSIAAKFSLPRYIVALVIVRRYGRSKRITKMCTIVIRNDTGVPYSKVRPLIDRSKLLGVCPICEQHCDNLNVDHCHTSGIIRGLLCGPCNRGIGLLKEKRRNFKNAITYLHNSIN